MFSTSSTTMPSNTADDCSICLSALAAGSPLLTLSCNHKFHLQCLAKNIQAQNKECPLCRAAIDASVLQLLTGPIRPPIPQQNSPFNFGVVNQIPAVNVIPSVEDLVDEAAVRTLSDRLAAASANAPSNPPLIKVSTTLEYGAQISHKESNIYGLVTLQALSTILPSAGESLQSSRVPIDLVCVVDQSGSMSGEKMRLLKQTLVYIAEQLNDLDRLAIVSFDTEAFDRSHGLKRMNEQNKQILTRAINIDIPDGGGTYIGCGLQMGINLFTNRQTKNPVGALLVLTDGQDNQEHDYSQLIGTLPEGVPCHTFGYGPDHTAALLVRLAELGNGGTFTYVDQEQAVGPAFAMALGGLFSCVAQQLRVDIEFNGQYKITHVHSKYQHEPKKLPSNKVTLKLKDLNAEEKRNLVFQLYVPKVDNDQNIEMASQQIMSQDEQSLFDQQNIGHVTLTYIQPNNDQTITTIPVFFQLIRTAQPSADQLQVNYTLDIQRNRVETAREIKRAMDESNYQRSLAILKAQVEKIKASVSAQDQFCQLLIKDLQHRYPSERDYRSSNFNTYMQHASERGTYAPTCALSSTGYASTMQQQQVFHFQQQQQPPPYVQQQLPPPYVQQQLPPPYVQQQQPPQYIPQHQPFNIFQQQQPSPFTQQQQAAPSQQQSLFSFIQPQQPALSTQQQQPPSSTQQQGSFSFTQQQQPPSSTQQQGLFSFTQQQQSSPFAQQQQAAPSQQQGLFSFIQPQQPTPSTQQQQPPDSSQIKFA